MSKVAKILYDPVKFDVIKQIVGDNFGERFWELTERASGNVKGFINPKGSKAVTRNLFESLIYPFTGLPRDIFDFVAKKLGTKFPKNKVISKVNKWQWLSNYRQGKEKQGAERVLRGMYQKLCSLADKDGNNLLSKVMDVEVPVEVFSKHYDEFFNAIFKELDKNAAPNVAKYNTRDGEGLKRLATGLIPIPFLFRDSFYISKKNGVNDKEARKMAQNKANQELISAGGEALSQFTVLGGVPNFVNSSQFAAPLINTAIGIGFHIISRLRTGRKLTHLSKEQIVKRMKPHEASNFNDFKKYVVKKENLGIKEPEKDGKKRFLSFKNLLIFAGTSIVAGFALAMGKNKALDYIKKEGNENKFVTKAFNSITEGYKNITRKKIEAPEGLFENFAEMLRENCNEDMIDPKLLKALSKLDENGKVFLGEVDKVVKLPILGVQMSLKKLIELPFVPFRILFELASYPYKAVKAILEQAITKVAKASDNAAAVRKTPRDMLEKIGLLPSKQNTNLLGAHENKYDIINLYNKFAELTEKFKDKPDGPAEAFNEFFDKNFKKTFDMERASKIDNSKIGKLTQLMGLTGGIYFASNDDYNQTLMETGSLEKAQADQRKRGVQKFTRVTTSVAITDWFNSTFARNYNSSLLGTLAVVGASTFMVDKATRFMLGQPSKKLTNEQLEEYEEQKQKGFMAPFYRFTEKIAE